MKNENLITIRTNKLLHALRTLEYRLDKIGYKDREIRTALLQQINRKKQQLAYKRNTCPHCGKPLNI